VWNPFDHPFPSHFTLNEVLAKAWPYDGKYRAPSGTWLSEEHWSRAKALAQQGGARRHSATRRSLVQYRPGVKKLT
jgi:hypothetical protein